MTDGGAGDRTGSAADWIEMVLLAAPAIGVLATAASVVLRRRRRAEDADRSDRSGRGRHGWPQALCEAIDRLEDGGRERSASRRANEIPPRADV